MTLESVIFAPKLDFGTGGKYRVTPDFPGPNHAGNLSA